MEQQRTSTIRISDRSGFTLMEMLVVVALIGLLASLALPSVSSVFRVSLASSTRKMATIIKETYNSTMITGRVHRLVYDLKENQFWVESGPPNLLLDTEDSLARDEKKGIKAEEKKKPSFVLETTITKEKESLPDGVAFEDLITEGAPKPIKEGLAYTHFFPHGLAEQTIIHLKDDQDHKTSLVITSLSGKTRKFDEYVEKEDVFGK